MKKTSINLLKACLTSLFFFGMSFSNAFAGNFVLSEDIKTGLRKQTLETLNPINQGNQAGVLINPGSIITRVIQFAFPLAGLILFLMLVLAGFEMMAGSATKKSIEDGKKRATNAVLGFILLFSVYWIAQLIGYIFQIDIV